MDITFSKFFASSESQTDDRVVAPPKTGDAPMLSHRSEIKHEEPAVTPTIRDNTTPIRQQAKQESTSTPSAVIGPKIRFKGELVGEEDLLIQGHVEGTIDLKDNKLIVGEQGALKANVSAKTLNIEGKVEGDLVGGECIAIRSSSKVQGNVKAARVILEDGAKFRGSIDMDVDEPIDSKMFASQVKEKHVEKADSGDKSKEDV